MEDVFVKKEDIKLQALQSWKVQKLSTMLQGKTCISLTLPAIKTKLKNGS